MTTRYTVTGGIPPYTITTESYKLDPDPTVTFSSTSISDHVDIDVAVEVSRSSRYIKIIAEDSVGTIAEKWPTMLPSEFSFVSSNIVGGMAPDGSVYSEWEGLELVFNVRPSLEDIRSLSILDDGDRTIRTIVSEGYDTNVVLVKPEIFQPWFSGTYMDPMVYTFSIPENCRSFYGVVNPSSVGFSFSAPYWFTMDKVKPIEWKFDGSGLILNAQAPYFSNGGGGIGENSGFTWAADWSIPEGFVVLKINNVEVPVTFGWGNSLYLNFDLPYIQGDYEITFFIDIDNMISAEISDDRNYLRAFLVNWDETLGIVPGNIVLTGTLPTA